MIPSLSTWHAFGRSDKSTVPGFDADRRVEGRSKFREARFRAHITPLIDSIIERNGTCLILDMGGDIGYWAGSIPNRNIKICLLNIEARERPSDSRFEVIQGDARNAPELPDDAFDLVHSNSLIEHVGRWSDMKRAASEIRRLSSAYYVQTPNFWFPIDPHSNLLCAHWLPGPVQRSIYSSKSRGFYKKPDGFDAAMALIDGTNMLDARQMTELFPDGELHRERFGPLTKSFVSIRR
ncbi:class I SAM-dependent methyltransferase [Methylobacterium marchantiae]|uniref:Class I SAM-dependent methyltransferase n=1 Tax=Methylobacterium marchantiae TaxID=600331 RepID=A0ABW3X2P0_9HYPH|nr:hypothetical protein AIGOOFII_3178 [Methylobacterium marchantiae]